MSEFVPRGGSAFLKYLNLKMFELSVWVGGSGLIGNFSQIFAQIYFHGSPRDIVPNCFQFLVMPPLMYVFKIESRRLEHVMSSSQGGRATLKPIFIILSNFDIYLDDTLPKLYKMVTL